MKKYKLIFSKDTFLWIKNKKGLVYQSENYRRFDFSLTDKLLEVCQYLLQIDNLYTIELSDDELANEDVRHFVDQLVDIGAGKLISVNDMVKGAVSLMPVLVIREDVHYYIQQHEKGIGGSIIKHIQELNFYINGSKYGNDRYYQQTIFPTNGLSILESAKIIQFIKKCKNQYLYNINLIGDIFLYSGYIELINCILTLDIPVTICLTAGDFLDYKDILQKPQWHENISFHILISQPSDADLVATTLNSLEIPQLNTIFVFSQQDCLHIDNIALSLNSNVVPLYNGKNIDFFESCIFIRKEDVLATALSKREIFMRQVTNTHQFGKLTVLPDGSVYADVNKLPLGTIDDTPYSIVYQEFTKGDSWFRIRNQVPCLNCIYQWLCPSPSNYETVIGRPNLCYVK